MALAISSLQEALTVIEQLQRSERAEYERRIMAERAVEEMRSKCEAIAFDECAPHNMIAHGEAYIHAAKRIYDAIASLKESSAAKTLNSTLPENVWPSGCIHPGSCSRHGQCMYLNCQWEGQKIAIIKMAPPAAKTAED